MRCLKKHTSSNRPQLPNIAEEDSGYPQGLGRGHGRMGNLGGGQWEPPVSFRHNPGDYSLMCRIVDTRTHRLAPDGGTGAELTHPPTWDPYPGSLGCCAPLEDHGEAKDGSRSLLLSLHYPFPYTSRRTQCSFLCSPLPYPSSTLLPLHSSLKMAA